MAITSSFAMSFDHHQPSLQHRNETYNNSRGTSPNSTNYSPTKSSPPIQATAISYHQQPHQSNDNHTSPPSMAITNGINDHSPDYNYVQGSTNAFHQHQMEHNPSLNHGRSVNVIPFPPCLDFNSEPSFIHKRNERERIRVRHVNEGYAKLRDHLPRKFNQKRLSKVETLRAAIRYIKHLEDVLKQGQDHSS